MRRKMPITGEETTDLDKYLDAWKELARPIEELTDWELSGFDPGLHFRHKDHRSSRSLILPLDFVAQINALLTDRETALVESIKRAIERCIPSILIPFDVVCKDCLTKHDVVGVTAIAEHCKWCEANAALAITEVE